MVATALLLIACDNDERSRDQAGNREPLIEGTGTVAQMFSGFGEYLINGDDGEVYAPLELPEEFQIEGLRVSFSAAVVSFGEAWIPEAPTIISIVEIRSLPTEKE